MSSLTERDRAATEQRSTGPTLDTTSTMPPPSSWRLLQVWLALGVQSFGGGAATLYLIRQATVERRGWITEAEFTRDWSICQVAPGINLLGLTILIGWRLRGAVGVALSLLGLLLPSVTITVLLTALYASIRSLAVVQAALRGIIPATAGIGLLLALKMAGPPLADSRREGRASLLLSWGLLLGSGVAAALGHLPVVGILWGCGALGALARWRLTARPGEERAR